MDGEDEIEVDVYKERGEHWKEGRKKRKEIEGRTMRKRVNNITFYTNLVSSGVLMGAWYSFVSKYKPYFSL